MIFAGVNWQAVSIVGTLSVSAFVAIFGLYQARIADRRANSADRSATTAKTIELGVTELVDQLREEREHLEEQVHQCKGDCDELREQVRVLRGEVDTLRTALDNKDAEIIGYRRRLGLLGGGHPK